jgi:LysR family transcriptional regulator, regulator for metE and metH
MNESVLEIRHLRLVRALAEEGGPTRAAARLHLSQSAVSHQLAELEARLGVPLFTRVRRRLQLSTAGARVLGAAQRMLGEIDQVEADVRRGGPGRRVVRLAVESFTTYDWLAPVAVDLAGDHPAVELQIVLEARRDPVAAVVAGKLELAIASGSVRDDQLASVPVCDDAWVVVAPVDHPLARRAWIDARDLDGQLVYVHGAPKSDVERLRGVFSAARVAMPRVVRVALTDVIVDLVRAGLGLGLVSGWAVAGHLRRGEIAARRLTRAGVHDRWSAVFRRAAPGELPVARVAQLIARQIGRPRRRGPRPG